MSSKEYILKDFKDYLPIKIDISDKEWLVYRPIFAPNKLKKTIEPSLTEEQLYNHMREISKWSFSKDGCEEFYKQDCIDFLRDIDFQSFSQYGKLTQRCYLKAKSAYLFDAYLRNFLQEILERIEIFLKKSAADAITLNYQKPLYIFEDEELYFSKDTKKYSKENQKRCDLVLKTKYHLSRLILDKKDDSVIQEQLEEYGVVLPWTVFRLMTFGNIASFLIALQPDYRNKVADYISRPLCRNKVITARVLLSWCNGLRYLRNICSHNSRLYGRLHHTSPMIHHANKETISELKADNDNIDKQLFVYFLSMRHITLAMSKESQKFWNDKMETLKQNSVNHDINLNRYGFPVNWSQLLAID